MIESLVIWLIIGAIAGWLAGLIVKGYGLGLVGNIVVGIIGAIIAGWLLPMIGFVLVGGILAWRCRSPLIYLKWYYVPRASRCQPVPARRQIFVAR